MYFNMQGLMHSLTSCVTSVFSKGLLLKKEVYQSRIFSFEVTFFVRIILLSLLMALETLVIMHIFAVMCFKKQHQLYWICCQNQLIQRYILSQFCNFSKNISIHDLVPKHFLSRVAPKPDRS